jgi:hypothetical protein
MFRGSCSPPGYGDQVAAPLYRHVLEHDQVHRRAGRFGPMDTAASGVRRPRRPGRDVLGGQIGHSHKQDGRL